MVIDGCAADQRQMHTRVAAHDLPLTQFAFKFGDQHAAPFGIDRPHSPDMPGEMSFTDEFSHCRLIHVCRADVHGLPYACEALRQVHRNHEVAQAHGWEHYLAEIAYIDDPVPTVQALQGPDWHAVVAIFAVVIILNDPCVHHLCPLKQLESAHGAHRNAERVLVRGRDKRSPRLSSEPESELYVQALRIHRHGNGAATRGS